MLGMGLSCVELYGTEIPSEIFNLIQYNAELCSNLSNKVTCERLTSVL